MESRKKLKSRKNDDEASTPRTSASNTTAVNESSSRDQDSRRILGDATTQTDNHPSDDNDSFLLSTSTEATIHRELPCGYLDSTNIEHLVSGVLYHGAVVQEALSSPAEGLRTAMVATTSNQASSYQLHPNIAINQPASSSTSGLSQAPLPSLQPGLGPLNQPGSSSNSGRNQAPLDRLKQRRLTSKYQSGPSSNPGLNRAPSFQLPLHSGSLNQTESNSTSGFSQAPLPSLLPGLGPLNQPGSSSNPGCNPASLPWLQQHHLVPVYQRGSSSNPGLNRAPSQLNVLSWSNAVQKNPLPQHRNNQAPFNRLQHRFVSPQSGSSSNPGLSQAPSLLFPQSNVLSWSNAVQQNPLPQHKNNQEHLTQLRNLQILHPELWAFMENKDKMYQSRLHKLSARCQRLESELLALKHSLHPNITVQESFQGAENRSRVQQVHAKPDNNLIHIQSQPSPSPSPSIPESGPGSTSGYITADDESNRPVSIAAAEVVLSTIDADRSGSNTESKEVQGNKENSDTS